MPSPVRRRSRPISCDACPLRRNPAFREFDERELAFVKSFKSGELEVEPGATVLVDGESSAHLYTILGGWAVRYKSLENGRRQILNFAFPGDLVGLQSSLFGTMRHTVEALTTLRLCVFDRDKFWRLFEGHPSLAFDVTWLAAREELTISQHLATIGRRTAIERIAYVIVFLYDRAMTAGIASGRTLSVPLTQEDIADVMGLSVVHTNKVLKQLAADGLARWTRSRIEIIDEAALRALSGRTGEEPSRSAPRPFI